jgi:hypothetical protein
MYKTLRKARVDWERGLMTILRLDRDGAILVVLHKPFDRTEFHCHRYFQIGDRWECSVDGQKVSLTAVFSWLTNPCAASTQPDHYSEVISAAQEVTPVPVFH